MKLAVLIIVGFIVTIGNTQSLPGLPDIDPSLRSLINSGQLTPQAAADLTNRAREALNNPALLNQLLNGGLASLAPASNIGVTLVNLLLDMQARNGGNPRPGSGNGFPVSGN